MMALLALLLGAVGGAVGTAGWLLSEPGPLPPSRDASPSAAQSRWYELQVRFHDARAQGQKAGQEEEARLKQRLEAYRRDPSRPAVS